MDLKFEQARGWMNRASEFKSFWEKGYLIIRNVFETDEMQILRRVITSQPGMRVHADEVKKRISQGERPSFETIFVWNDTSNNDIFSKAVRSHRIIEGLKAF